MTLSNWCILHNYNERDTFLLFKTWALYLAFKQVKGQFFYFETIIVPASGWIFFSLLAQKVWPMHSSSEDIRRSKTHFLQRSGVPSCLSELQLVKPGQWINIFPYYIPIGQVLWGFIMEKCWLVDTVFSTFWETALNTRSLKEMSFSPSFDLRIECIVA